MELAPKLLEPFAGYLALGMYLNANDELERLPTDLKTHPSVLSARLELLMEMERWEDSSILGASLCKLWPERCEYFVWAAYCLHELKRTKDAKETLLGGPEALRKQAVFYYNLACYEAQLGNITEAKKHLTICFKMEPRFRDESLDDLDLEPVWRSPKDA